MEEQSFPTRAAVVRRLPVKTILVGSSNIYENWKHSAGAWRTLLLSCQDYCTFQWKLYKCTDVHTCYRHVSVIWKPFLMSVIHLKQYRTVHSHSSSVRFFETWKYGMQVKWCCRNKTLHRYSRKRQRITWMYRVCKTLTSLPAYCRGQLVYVNFILSCESPLWSYFACKNRILILELNIVHKLSFIVSYFQLPWFASHFVEIPYSIDFCGNNIFTAHCKLIKSCAELSLFQILGSETHYGALSLSGSITR